MARVFQCSDCGRELTKSVDAPMLRYKVWIKLAKADECLCHKCLYNRSITREVPVHLADLMPCAYNLFNAPQSWFDLFLSEEDQEPSPELVREWKAAIAWLGSADAIEAALQGKLPAILSDMRS
jgi:hypothetical protein